MRALRHLLELLQFTLPFQLSRATATWVGAAAQRSLILKRLYSLYAGPCHLQPELRHLNGYDWNIVKLTVEHWVIPEIKKGRLCMPKVSVIIPTHNRAEFLRSA